MANQSFDPQTGFQPYFEMERRARSAAQWLMAVCLTAAVASASGFVFYGTNAITRAEDRTETAMSDLEEAQGTISSLNAKIADLESRREPPSSVTGNDNANTIRKLRADLAQLRIDYESLQQKYDAMTSANPDGQREALDKCHEDLVAAQKAREKAESALKQCAGEREKYAGRINQLEGLILRTLKAKGVEQAIQLADKDLYADLLAAVGRRPPPPLDKPTLGGRPTSSTSGTGASGVVTGGRTTG